MGIEMKWRPQCLHVCGLVGLLAGTLACQDPVGVSPTEIPLPFVILSSSAGGVPGSPSLTVHQGGLRLLGSSIKSECCWVYSARLLPSPPGLLHVDVLSNLLGGLSDNSFQRVDYQIDVAEIPQGEQLRVLWTETIPSSTPFVFLVLDTTIVSP